MARLGFRTRSQPTSQASAAHLQERRRHASIRKLSMYPSPAPLNSAVCLPGFGGPSCDACAVGTWSQGGNSSVPRPSCNGCTSTRYTTASDRATALSQCTGNPTAASACHGQQPLQICFQKNPAAFECSSSAGARAFFANHHVRYSGCVRTYLLTRAPHTDQCTQSPGLGPSVCIHQPH